MSGWTAAVWMWSPTPCPWRSCPIWPTRRWPRWAAVSLGTKSHCASDSQKTPTVSSQEITLTFTKVPLYFHSVNKTSAFFVQYDVSWEKYYGLVLHIKCHYSWADMVLYFRLLTLRCWLNKIWLPKQAIRFNTPYQQLSSSTATPRRR